MLSAEGPTPMAGFQHALYEHTLFPELRSQAHCTPNGMDPTDLKRLHNEPE